MFQTKSFPGFRGFFKSLCIFLMIIPTDKQTECWFNTSAKKFFLSPDKKTDSDLDDKGFI